MIGAIRRRMIGNKSGKYPSNYPSNVAFTIDDNPAMMAICYKSGFAANPNYITIDEAGLVRGSAGQFNKPDVTHMDLRYFTGLVTNMSYALGNISGKKLTLPAKPSPMAVNSSRGAAYSDFTVIIPPEVTDLDLHFINNTTSGKNAKVICESATPLRINQWRKKWFADMPISEIVMYVPSNGINAYKEHSVFGQYEIRSIDEYVE